MNRLRTRLSAAVIAVAAIPFLVASPAVAAAYPETHYSLSYGGGEYTLKGNLIWYNRSVQVGASLKAGEGNCATAQYTFVHNNSAVSVVSRSACAETVGHGFSRQYDYPGGITEVDIALFQSNGSGSSLVDTSICDRSGCS
jgi:hypothetical protein